ncbi:mediator of RNA polymerase II transcription subunit 8-A-like isoform X2 [Clytia hemisphaerica]|uniref:Mediator of RNA polymerase II transcription subunit 8 n=1 Tax=Clytia hemisphaerica TaxID=252671 RepID=A0A7M5WWK7_9CNID
MQQEKEENVIATSLQNLIGRVSDIKMSIQNFMFKLEHETLSWPQMLDNFALLSGQISTLNKLLKNDRMPVLRNLCILPLMVSQERDTEMEEMTENRIPVVTHEVVPDALRTKYEPDVEKVEEELTLQSNSISVDMARSQVVALNDLIGSMLDLIQNSRDWETESSVEQADLAPSANDTNILLAAITQGSGLRKSSTCFTYTRPDPANRSL